MEHSGEVDQTIEKRKSKLKKWLFGWVEDNYDKVFLIVLILAFIIRFWVFLKTKDQAIWWDAADYLATAKRWAGVNPNLLDIWYYRRGFFWPLFATVFFALGLGEIGLRFSVVLFSTGIVFISYFLIKKMFNKKLALLTSIGVTFSWIILFFSGRPLTSLPSTFFILLALLFFWKGYVLKEGNRYLYLFGVFYALAVLTRMQHLSFAPLFLIFFLLKEKFRFIINKTLWITLGIFILIMAPQIILHNQHFGNPFLDLAAYYLGIEGISATQEIGGGFFSIAKSFRYFTDLPNMLTKPIFVVFLIGLAYFSINIILGLDKILKNKDLQKKLFVLLWVFTCFFVLGYMAPNVEQRYIMPSITFLFLIVAYPFGALGSFLNKTLKLKRGVVIILVSILLIILLIPNILFANNLIEAKKTSYLEVKLSGEWIKEHSEPTDLIISASLPQTTYYSERNTNKFYLARRRDEPPKNETEFYEYIEKEKPRYMILSVFELGGQREWGTRYPETHPNRVFPVQVYQQNGQPVLIIYEFNYSDLDE